MHFTKKNSLQKREELRKKLEEKKILKFPGAYNPLTAKIIEEMGDVMWYFQGLCSRLQITIPDVLQNNIEKIRKKNNEVKHYNIRGSLL